jgi:hypothetical protein
VDGTSTSRPSKTNRNSVFLSISRKRRQICHVGRTRKVSFLARFVDSDLFVFEISLFRFVKCLLEQTAAMILVKPNFDWEK